MDFSRKYRITSTKDYREVYNYGKWFNSSLLDVSAKSNTLGITRLGLSVSKAVGNANERNLVKRRIRNLFVSIDNINKGWDIVVIPKRESVKTNFQLFRKTFLDSLLSLSIIPEYNLNSKDLNEK
ncbi:MAG: ribonuclease P protein component [Dehalococcoidia bacterium]